jgi:oxygen-independent coproporphyrinogen-3 oxidase
VALGAGVPHVSVYMLEVDEDSRLGREMLKAGNREHGTGNTLKYGAGDVPSEDGIAEWYGAACEWLEADGVRQYEISNFARAGHRSRHNVKYWRREAYVGFGLDAHSMLRDGVGGARWANTDDLDRYLGHRAPSAGRQGSAALVQFGGGGEPDVERIGREKAFEEAMFLGLRLNDGVDLEALGAEFTEELMQGAMNSLEDIEEAGLVVLDGNCLRLTAPGRMASNEVFSRLLVGAAA